MYACVYVSLELSYIKTMKIKTATRLAATIRTKLAPYCDRVEIAGGIRRGNVRGMDLIDIVAISKLEMQPDIFMQMQPAGRNRLFRYIRNAYDVTQGGKDGQKQVTFMVCDTIAVRISLATPETWGYILALKTGPPGLSKALVIKLKKAGYEPAGGMLLRDSKMVPVPAEHNLFAMAGVRYVSPAMR